MGFTIYIRNKQPCNMKLPNMKLPNMKVHNMKLHITRVIFCACAKVTGFIVYSDDSEMVIHSDNAIAPVGYLRLNKMHLVPKEIPSIMRERLNSISLKDADGYITDPGEEATEQTESEDSDEDEETTPTVNTINGCIPIEHPVMKAITNNGWMWCAGIAGYADTVEEAMESAMDKLESRYASYTFIYDIHSQQNKLI